MGNVLTEKAADQLAIGADPSGLLAALIERGVTEQDAAEAIKSAAALLEQEGAPGQSLRWLKAMRAKAYKADDMPTALAIQKEIHELLRLKEPPADDGFPDLT